jgi:hypothetical protein
MCTNHSSTAPLIKVWCTLQSIRKTTDGQYTRGAALPIDVLIVSVYVEHEAYKDEK